MRHAMQKRVLLAICRYADGNGGCQAGIQNPKMSARSTDAQADIGLHSSNKASYWVCNI